MSMLLPAPEVVQCRVCIFPDLRQIFESSATTCLRCSCKYYMGFVENSVLFPVVKQFLKSVKNTASTYLLLSEPLQ